MPDSEPTMPAPKPRHAARWILAFIGASIVAFLAVNYWPVDGHITIGYDTTRITGPLNADGTVNYAAYLNALNSKGVTPENNAAVLLLKAVGPDAIEVYQRTETFRVLGMSPLPNDGHYLCPKPNVPGLSPPTSVSASSNLRGESETGFSRFRTRPWVADEYPAIAKWLADNREPLVLALEASHRQRFFLPLVTPNDRAIALVPEHRMNLAESDIANALQVRAMGAVGATEFSAARRDAMAVHRLARLLTQGADSIGFSAARIVEERACEIDAVIAMQAQLPVQDARELLTELQSLQPMPDCAVAIDTFERFRSLEFMTSLARSRDVFGGLADGGSGWRTPAEGLNGKLDWDLALKMVNLKWDHIVRERAVGSATFQPGWRDGLSIEIPATPEDRERMRSRMSRARLGGRLMRPELTRELTSILFVMLFSKFDYCEGVSCERAVARLDLARLAAGMAVFRLENGVYPEKLQDLETTFGRALPVDPFGGNAFVYRRHAGGYVLYSVGENLVDDGGKDEQSGGDDIVVRVPMTAATAPATGP